MKKVSVIITTYKRSDFLTRAIESVFNQTYKNIEIIVVDDNEENSVYRKETEKKVEKYKDRLIYIKHKKNMNGAVARNTGINNCSGEYITFLDDDDEFINNRIEKMVYSLESSNYKVAYSDVKIIHKNNFSTLSKISECKSGNLKKELFTRELDIGTGSNIFLDKDVINNIGRFDINFKRHQDWEFLIRVLRRYEIKFVNEILVIKHMDSRINFPNSYVLEEVKNIFFKTFEDDIEEFEDNIKKKIFDINNKDLIYSYASDLRIKLMLEKLNKLNFKLDVFEKIGIFKIIIKSIVKKRIKMDERKINYN